MSKDYAKVDKSMRNRIESYTYLRAILDSLEDELLIIDRDYCIVDANQAVLNKHRKTRKQIVGKTCFQVSHGLPDICCLPYHQCPLSTVWETGRACRTTHIHEYLDSDDKKKRYLDIIASPIHDANGNIIAVAELMRDVTTAKEMELRITEAHQSLLALTAIANAVSQSLELDTVLNTALKKTLEIVKLNTGCILLWDESRESLCYKVHHGLSEEYIQKEFCSFDKGIAGRVAKTGKAILIEDMSPGSDEIDEIWPHISRTTPAIQIEGLKAVASVPLISKERILGVLSVASRERRKFSPQDIQLLESIAAQIAIALENAKLHQEVQRKDEIRGELLREIFSIQEEERKRIARELHDETSQVVASMVANLEIASALLAVDKEKASARLIDAKNLSIGILDEIHKIIYELRPTLLDDLGLISAIRWLVDNNLRAQGICVNFKTTGRKKRLLPYVETTLFRVIQEVVTNIARHAGAKNVILSLHYRKDAIQFKVSDDGRGFNVEEAINSRERPRGLGVLGMMERVELMSGKVEISSTIGAGTKIDVTIPTQYKETTYEQDSHIGGR